MTISITDDARARVLEVRGREHDPQGLTLWVEVVAVSDAEIVAAMRFCFERLKVVVEPSGASALAALLAGRVDAAGGRVGVVLSGGNVDPQRFGSLLLDLAR